MKTQLLLMGFLFLFITCQSDDYSDKNWILDYNKSRAVPGQQLSSLLKEQKGSYSRLIESLEYNIPLFDFTESPGLSCEDLQIR